MGEQGHYIQYSATNLQRCSYFSKWLVEWYCASGLLCAFFLYNTLIDISNQLLDFKYIFIFISCGMFFFNFCHM